MLPILEGKVKGEGGGFGCFGVQPLGGKPLKAWKSRNFSKFERMLTPALEHDRMLNAGPNGTHMGA